MDHDLRSSYGRPDRQTRVRELVTRCVSTLPRFALTLASALIVAMVFRILVLDDLSSSVGKLVGDDAGYYFGIARNVVLGYGYSFDRVEPTNGFNPLFTILLVLAYGTLLPAGLPIEGCYRVGVGITFILLLAAAWFFVRVLGALLSESSRTPEHLRILTRAALFMFLGVYAFKQVHGVDYLMELLLILAYAWHVLKHGALPSGWRQCATGGALLGLAFLARVDTLCLLATTYGSLAFLTARRRLSWRPLAISISATAVVVLPYFVGATTEFGTWLPVSAMLKTSFPNPDLGASAGLLWQKLAGLDKVSFSLSFILSLYYCTRLVMPSSNRAVIPGDRPATLLLILSLYVTARMAWMLLFTRFDVQSGYLGASFSYNAIMMLSLVAEGGKARVPGRWTEWATAIMVIVGVGGLLFGAFLWRRSVEFNQGPAGQLVFARAVHELTSPSALLYGEAFGMAAFLADRRWMNGDGVVGSIEHFRILQAGDRDELYRYIERHGVTHIVTMDGREAGLGEVVYQQRLRDRRNATVYLVRLTPGWVDRKESMRDTDYGKKSRTLKTVMVKNETVSVAAGKGTI